MRLRLVASQPQYLVHMRPIWDALPDACKAGEFLFKHDRPLPIEPGVINLVAGHSDIQRAPVQKFILVEHGAGQSYDWKYATGPIADGSYSGGRGYNNCLGFICPNIEVAQRWFKRYPNVPSAVVGCPKLDPWHNAARGTPEPRTVAITFHWDALFSGVPETSSAFSAYHDYLFDIICKWKRDGWTVLGHWHPRYPAVEEFWKRLNKQIGVEVIADAAEILDRATILVADNTSMQAEFLSLGRRVVWLNHDAYRHDVEHGGRFWHWPQQSGLSVDNAADLLNLDLDTVPATTWHPYAFADGEASTRASHAIQFWLRSEDVPQDR